MGSLGSVNVLSHQGYRDCYPTGSLEDPHLGMLPPSLGEAMRHRPDFVQLTTWNDYTEGTMLEPSWLRAPWLFHSVYSAPVTVFSLWLCGEFHCGWVASPMVGFLLSSRSCRPAVGGLG